MVRKKKVHRKVKRKVVSKPKVEVLPEPMVEEPVPKPRSKAWLITWVALAVILVFALFLSPGGTIFGKAIGPIGTLWESMYTDPADGIENYMCVQDISGSNIHMERMGGLRCGIDASLGLGTLCDFDGVDDYLTLPVGEANHLHLRGAKTVLIDVRPETQTGSQGLVYVGKANAVDANDLFYVLSYNAENNGNLWYFGEGGEWFRTDYSLPLNQWSKVALVHDGSSVHIYVNGEEQRLTPAVGASPVIFGYEGWADPRDALSITPDQILLEVGRRSSGPNNYYFDGKMANLKIWGRALTQQQIIAEQGVEYEETVFSRVNYGMLGVKIGEEGRGCSFDNGYGSCSYGGSLSYSYPLSAARAVLNKPGQKTVMATVLLSGTARRWQGIVFVGRQSPTTASDYVYLLAITSDDRFAYYGGDGRWIETVNTISRSQAHNIAMVHTGTQVSLYVDGVQMSLRERGDTQTQSYLVNDNGGVVIGDMDVHAEVAHWGPFDNYYFEGTIQELMVSDDALTTEQIRETQNIAIGRLNRPCTAAGECTSDALVCNGNNVCEYKFAYRAGFFLRYGDRDVGLSPGDAGDDAFIRITDGPYNSKRATRCSLLRPGGASIAYSVFPRTRGATGYALVVPGQSIRDGPALFSCNDLATGSFFVGNPRPSYGSTVLRDVNLLCYHEPTGGDPDESYQVTLQMRCPE